MRIGERSGADKGVWGGGRGEERWCEREYDSGLRVDENSILAGYISRLMIPTVFIAIPQHGFKAFQPIVVIEVIG